MIFSHKKIGGENPFFFKNHTYKIIDKNKFEKINYYLSGRNAILDVIKCEKINHVYIPKYYCYPVFELLNSLSNIKVYNYANKNQLIEKLSKDNKITKILIIILFFNGMRISINDYLNIKELKNSNIVNLIDAAMTPSLNKIDFDYDYLITNPRKFYWISLGTFLFSKSNSPIKYKFSLNFLKNFFYLLSKLFARFLLSSRLDQFENFGLKVNNYSEQNVPIKLDFISLLFIKNLKIIDLSAQRIEQYNIYFEMLQPISRFYFFSTPASRKDCPYGFIIRFRERDKLRKFLNNYRIFPSNLWEVPSELYPILDFETITISNQILLLPIGRHYNKVDIRRLCKLVLIFFKNENYL